MSTLSEHISGTVFDIQRFSIHDGPGIRTNVFLKGCPLRCAWCHNPESYTRTPDLFYDARKCIGCGACASVCPQHCHSLGDREHTLRRDLCIHCGKCAGLCPTGALEMSGRQMTVKEVLNEVLRDQCFYRDKGGMTITGGEPMYQPDFTLALVKEAKELGIHVCMETSGFCRKEVFETVIPYVDLFLFDMKETDPERHKRFTGVSPELIWWNLELLENHGSDVILRCPLIPSYNDREEHLASIAAWANRLSCVKEIHVEPYHNLGVSKLSRLGAEDLQEIPVPDAKNIEGWIGFLAGRTDRRVRRA